MLYNADIWQNFTLDKVKLENQKKPKEAFTQKLKKQTKVYANPRLS